MTTFQDPPPQSRRSARQNERGEQQVTGEQPDFSAQVDATATAGRRARPAESEPLAPEPLIYTTQGQVPAGYEALPGPSGYTPMPQDPAGYRVRDFSPEGSARRAAAPPLVEPAQPFAAPPEALADGASDLDYRTQAGPVAAAPPAPAVETADAPPLSRRELRQRQAEAEAAAVAGAPAPVSSPLQYAPPPTAAPPIAMAPPPPAGPPSTATAPPPQHAPAPSALSNAMAEFEALTRTGQAPAPAPAPAPAAAPASAAAPPAAPPPLVDPAFAAPKLEQTGSWVAPVGHWSRQADLDDETQPWENTITREVGGGNVATTTSALVLPEIPRPSDFQTALDSTGEVLLTGSIDLPQSLSTGGGDPRRYDDPNVDLMFDTQDAEFTGTDSSPVRAIRAVSTHTSSRGVIHANKPHGNRMLVVVFVGTAALAVSVVALFIASIVLDVF